ncbi:hypothetical protein P6166_03925 [Stenotrophomonas sp. HITSZ_GD]|uniref:hypothetical protein n=1 Tax=Stenotrophomonas sp. HITSZ_GD TaxID=3037248 RepID=UPI00240E7F11|nr:hypothetical protein [Stenotrophomonas sp. HITSZ_GD]MDG2524507.1 hypothetical protein [Stenotrophomonas sp. HITSZ_GD]
MEDRRRQRHAQPEPFWSRVRAITFYPLQGAALWSLLALTLCTLLGVVPGIGWIFSLVTWLAVYRYAFEILRHTANGHPGAPEYALELGDGAVIRLFALSLLVIAGLIAVAFLTRSVGMLLLTIGVIALMQPGMVISLALDGSLRRALNPLVPLDLALRIGWPYLAAFCLLFVIQISTMLAGKWLRAYLPPEVSSVAFNFVAIWGLFSTFHLLGYLVYQYHEVLGFEPEALQDTRRADPDQRLLDEAEGHVRDGHPREAREALRGAIRGRAVSLGVHELYQRLLRKEGPSPELHDHAQQYISRLIAEKQERRALSLLREMLETDPDFTPAQVEQAIALVDRARMAGQHQLTVDALRAMVRKWPRHEAAAQWALDAALLLAERYGRDEEARALLETALVTCEDEDVRRRLQNALAAINPAATPAA